MDTPKWKKILILSMGLLENFIFSGSILGWSSLNYMLKEEGVYNYLCRTNNSTNSTLIIIDSDIVNDEYALTLIDDTWGHENEQHLNDLNKPEVCNEQDQILNLAYTIGSFCLGFTAFLWGFLLDKWGLKAIRLMINLMLTTGSVLLCLTKKERSYLLFPAVILICCGGVPLRIANMQIANLFPKRRSAVITLYSGAFSASAFSFVILKLIYDAGASFSWSCYFLVAISVIMLPTTILLLPSHLISDTSNLMDNLSGNCARITSPQSPPPPAHESIFMSKKSEIISPIIVGKFKYITDSYKTVSRNSPARCPPVNSSTLQGYHNAAFQASLSDLNSDLSSIQINSANASIPLTISLLSIAFLLHQSWYAWMVTYTTLYVGSMNLWLNRVTHDASSASDFSKIYGFCQISALILAPMAGFWMDAQINKANEEKDEMKKRIKQIKSAFLPMFFTTLMLVGIIACRFFNTHNSVYISIAFVTLLRSFMVAVGSAYLRTRFPEHHFNRLLGIISTISSIFSLIQFPIFIWEASGPKKFIEVNIFLAICTGLVMLNPLHLMSTRLQRKLLACEDRQSILR